MRLMDSVVTAPPSLRIEDGDRVFQIAGASAHAAAIKTCPVRYVLDDSVRQVCMQLLETDRGMLCPANSLLRMPAESFWLEWHEERVPYGSIQRHARRHVGILVNAALDGRSGSIHSFWKNDEGIADAGQVIVDFDLDANRASHAQQCIRAQHVELPEFQPLLDCMIFKPNPAWSEYFAELSAAQHKQTMDQCCAGAWFDLAFVFAFSTVLGAKGHVQSRPSDLTRLNKSRVKHGKATLLDHVETRIYIDDISSSSGGTGRMREAPRLHQVRGHLVRRANATFWRTTHLRGNPGTFLLQRNVVVTHRQR